MSPDNKELRGEAPAHLVAALDALALSNDMTRTAYVNEILARHVTKEMHKVTLLSRVLRGNPLLSESSGLAPDASRPT
jgi:hypothetical protein